MVDLTDSLIFLIRIPLRVCEVLADHTAFSAFGVEVNYLEVLLSALVICFVIGLFWRGAKA